MVAIIVIGGIIVWLRYSQPEEISITESPSEEVIERLEDKLGSENIYQTYDAEADEDNAHHTIELITDGERLWVKID